MILHAHMGLPNITVSRGKDGSSSQPIYGWYKCWDIPTAIAHTLLTCLILGQFYYWGVPGVFIPYPCLPMIGHKWLMPLHDAWEWQHQSKGLFYWGENLVSYSSNLSSVTGLVYGFGKICSTPMLGLTQACSTLSRCPINSGCSGSGVSCGTWSITQ